MIEFSDLVKAESDGLQAAVFVIVGDRHRAEEIVQESFERCFRRWKKVSRLDRPGAWVRRVAINEAISVTRKRSSERRALVRVAAREAAPMIDPFAAAGDDAIWMVVRALPQDQAAAIALRYGADLAVDEIAAAMDVSVPAVKSLLHRARQSLRTNDTIEELT